MQGLIHPPVKQSHLGGGKWQLLNSQRGHLWIWYPNNTAGELKKKRDVITQTTIWSGHWDLMIVPSLIALQDFLSFSRPNLSWAAYGNEHIFKLIKQLGHLLLVRWEPMTCSPWKHPTHGMWGKISCRSGTNSNRRQARNNSSQIGSFYSNQENSLQRNLETQLKG